MGMRSTLNDLKRLGVNPDTLKAAAPAGAPASQGLGAPTTTRRGGVLMQTAQANSAAAPTQTEFNNLLAKLRSAGVLAP